MAPIPVWLDADPGHDDAIAILLALHLPQIRLLGISTVHGNGSLLHTTLNAARLLVSFGSPAQARDIPIYSGSHKPLLRAAKHDLEIHGDDGLGGVEGLYDGRSDLVQLKLAESEGHNAVLAMADASRAMPGGDGDKGRLTIVATGTLTNAALFCAMFPELVRDKVSQIVLMGGAEGRGNRGPTAEFNILCDPEAAAIVFNAEVKVVMIPLNVSHTALFTPAINEKLLQHAKVFDFHDGPPVHDPLCLAFLSHPHLFKGKRYRVDCELAGAYTAGTTVVDLWEYRKDELTAMADPESRESWGAFGKNVWVAEEVDVPAFWDLFLKTVATADKVSPLNAS